MGYDCRRQNPSQSVQAIRQRLQSVKTGRTTLLEDSWTAASSQKAYLFRAFLKQFQVEFSFGLRRSFLPVLSISFLDITDKKNPVC